MIGNLEQDLLNSQANIISLLTQYQKTSEQIIRSSYASELHNLLENIASFDHQKIRQCENIIKDKTAIHYIDTIADKIRNSQQQKDKQVVNESIKVDPPKKIQQKAKSQEKESSAKKEGGLFDFVRKRFASKQKKAAEMIFPEEEPQCYYDPVTKTYVFEGQQPQAPKQIPKPPSVSNKKPKEEIRKEKDDSELSQLTAPPTFRRKSTPAGKGKIKIKEEVEAVKAIDEPLSFARIIEEINSSYDVLLEKVKTGAYQHPQIQIADCSTLSEFTSFVEKTILHSEEINHTENKIIDKWSRILTSESRELKIMEKVLRQMNQSAVVYSNILSKFEHPTIIKQVPNKDLIDVSKKAQVQKVNEQIQTQPIKKQFIVLKEMVDNQFDKEQIISLSKQLRNAKQEYVELNNKKLVLQQRIRRIIQQSNEKEDVLSTLFTNKKKELNDLNTAKIKQSKRYQQQIALMKQELNQKQLYYLQTINKLTDQFNDQLSNQNKKINQLQDLNRHLQHEKKELQHNLKKSKAQSSYNTQELKAQINRQKYKIEQLLKFTEEKERAYLRALKNMQEHEHIINQYDTSLTQQNQLLVNILKKRLQNNKHPEIELSITNKVHFDHSSSSFLLQISEIVGLVAQTSLDRLEQFSRSYSKLHSKYIQSKNLLTKVRNNAANQSISLNRSVTKLKTLLQTYKIAKTEAQDRCSQIELQCDKLKKKLCHYKEQDQFNKSYISKIKPSKINSQDESFQSLQEDKQQLATQIDDLHREIQVKDETLKKNQTDLQDLLINFEKNQQKLLQVQRKYKQSQKQARSYKQSRQKYENKIKLLQLKLQNQKERYDEVQNRQQSRIKSLQASFEKKLKLFKVQLDQSFERQNHLKTQIQQISKQFKTRIALLQQNHHSIENQLRNALTLKQSENMEIQALVQEVNQKIEIERQQKNGLFERNSHLMETQRQLNRKLNEIIDEHLKEIAIHRQTQQNMNNIISTILEKYNSFKQDQEEFKQQYDSKLYQLQLQLETSQQQSNDLLVQLNQYSDHTANLNAVIQEINAGYMRAKEINQSALKTLSQQNEKLGNQNVILKNQNDDKDKQNKEFEDLIQKMSEEMARITTDHESLSRDKIDLQQQLMFKDRQIQTLTIQVNKKSQELMIKTQQLQEKEEKMLEHQELSVMKKEQFDELKYQIINLNQQLSNKNQSIINLQRGLDSLRAELELFDTAKIQIKDLKDLILDLQQSIQSKDKYANSLDGHIQALRTELKDKKDQIIRLSSYIDEIQHKYQEKKSQVSKQQQAITALQSQLQQKAKQINDVRQASSALDALLQVKDQQITQMKILLSQAEENKQVVQTLNSTLAEITSKLETAEQQNQQLSNQIELNQISIKDLQRKAQEKQAQLGQINLKLLLQLQKQDSKQISENDEVEGEMEYLLKEIQSKDNKIQQLKQAIKENNTKIAQLQKSSEQLQTVIQKMNDQIQQKQSQAIQLRQTIHHNQQQMRNVSNSNLDLLTEIKVLKEQKKCIELENLSLSGKKHELQAIIRQHLTTIDELSQNLKVKQERQQQMAKLLLKDQSKVIEDLIADIHEKDEAIIQKERQIESEQHLIEQLQDDKNVKQEEIRNLQRTLSQKVKKIDEMQNQIKQKVVLLAQKDDIILKQEERVAQLEQNLTQLSAIIEHQQQIIQGSRSQKQTAFSEDQIKMVQPPIQYEKIQIQQLKHRLAVKQNQFDQKEVEYKSQIATLEQKLRNTSTNIPNKQLQQNYRTLLEENAALMNEKVELMKSNNYLVSINQKLVGQKSSSNMRQMHKAQSHIVAPSNNRPNLANEHPNSEITGEKVQSKGFFGTLSSLFLTPTQTDRLRK